MRFSFLLLFFSFALFANSFKFVANPYKEYYYKEKNRYARNIWDMQLYKSKIYIGGGNSSNSLPSPNAGRVPLYSISKNDTIQYEYKVAEEQINLFKIYDDTLYIPGHDATQKWEYGNFYELKNNKWIKYRTIPNALHVYDLVKQGNRIYVALGLIYYKGSILYSEDKKHWKVYKRYKHRVYSLASLNNHIIAGNDLVKANYKAIRLKKLQNSLFFISAKLFNDHQSIPVDFCKAEYKNKKIITTKIATPKNFLPYDILIRKNSIYLLLNRKYKDYYEIKVIKYNYKNLSQFTTVISFRYESFARSFEKRDGYFYFGIGCDTKNIQSSCGNILKIRG